MAENTIDLVRQAETAAEETARNASREALQIVDEAQREAIRLSNSAEDDARSTAADTVAAAHKQSQKELEKAAEALSGDMEVLAAQAAARQPDAVKMILDALV